MPDITQLPRGTLEEMLRNIFRISTFGGVFPFVFYGNNLVLSYKFLVLSIVYMVLVSCTTIYYLFDVLEKMPSRFLNYATRFSFITPHVLPLVVCTVSIFWQWINLEKFNKLFRTLKEVEDVTQSLSQLPYLKQYYYFFSIDVLLFVLDYSLTSYPGSLVILLYLITTNVYLVMIQFTSILATINNYYSILEDTLCYTRAMEWARYHEVLGSCCEIVNKCYSPQLLIFVIHTFLCVTSTIYVFIVYTEYYLPMINFIMAILWIILSSFSLWVFVDHCNETVQKARRFDKALSRLVLNDSTDKLLHNKRIIYHFKAKHKVEFSAMGFFNFDYSLLGKMVSTATTYIVIMVQIAPSST